MARCHSGFYCFCFYIERLTVAISENIFSIRELLWELGRFEC
jgi:hypothetical protein